MRLPDHLLKFWIHRLTKCCFKQGYGLYVNKKTSCRCAVGVLFPLTHNEKYLMNYGWSVAFIAKYQMFKDADTDGSMIDLNDEVQLSFEEIAKKLEELSETFEFVEDFIKHLDYIYQYAIDSGEYVETT